MKPSPLNPSVTPPQPLPAAAGVRRILESISHLPGDVGPGTDLLERPLHGTTLFIARCALETRHGHFTTYVFQDIISKSFLLALAHGDVLEAPVLYTRIHSSCVTSETLRGCDCDCVQQLEGALEVIRKKQHGILFYLMQEGRGVGYVAKARDRMLVQASGDRVSTFDAYHQMGLLKDHRDYRNVADICHLLGIRAEFIVLSNNPDKLEALRRFGLRIRGAEPLEFEPSPFNVAYLTSKAASGHILAQTRDPVARPAVPPEPVVPFKPRALQHAQRFIYTASYFLPVKPVDDRILVDRERAADLPELPGFASLATGPRPLILSRERLADGRMFLHVDPERLARLRRDEPDHPLAAILAAPYWFRVHVYYDIVSTQEFVVLTFGDSLHDPMPVVRVQSESLFNRFPLVNMDNREKFKKSIHHIVAHGAGAVVLLYYDGRGAGFGAFATDRMMVENGLCRSSDESYQMLGVNYDSRDYDATFLLLRRHLHRGVIQMVMNSPSSLVQKPEYAAALRRHHIEVDRWIFLGDDDPAG
ncbi:MAG: GTP cyclohydrolase [Puniceicoccaceae bacterium]|nr:MAG: GTP cyclohydrolase [Puniceicoccaceae bacterium]